MATDLTSALLAAASVPARRTIRAWMVQHYDEFAKATAAGPPDWSAIAKIFADQGYRGLTGKPPTPEGVRQTWWKVRRAKAKGTKAAQPPAQRGLPPRKPPPAVTHVSPPEGEDDDFNFGEPIR